ncbi:MAG TPA: metal-dependent hydrolase [Candidatus Limnocylindrales bacterium]|nr:metal-dependent hydrolase [Candidatus Limnocylindrales bacterium]
MALPSAATFTWYGHACWELRTPGGKTVLFDPWFGNPLSPRRPDDVAACDLLLVTHGHSDHFGDALSIASRTRPQWPCIHEMSLWLGRNFAHKDRLIGMNKGGTVEAAGLRVTMVRADHSGGDLYGGAESALYLGEPVGWVVELEDGFRFYFAGDTDVFSDMKLIGERFRPSLAFLPIGGHFTMDPAAAALAVELLGVEDVAPMHYGTFPLLAGTPDQLRAELAARGLESVGVHIAAPGGALG